MIYCVSISLLQHFNSWNNDPPQPSFQVHAGEKAEQPCAVGIGMTH